jgi:hypothetical protein
MSFGRDLIARHAFAFAGFGNQLAERWFVGAVGRRIRSLNFGF